MTSLPFKVPRTRGWLYTFIALLVFFATYISLPEFFQELEYRLYDYRLRLSSRPQPAREIVHVDISDTTEKVLVDEGSWPFFRRVHGQVIEVLSQCNVGVVVFDIFFGGQGRGFGSEEGNLMFSRALVQNGKVVIGTAVKLAREKELIRMELDEEDLALQDSFLNVKGVEVARLYQTEASRSPLPILSMSAEGVGHIAGLSDSDGIYRRFPLIIGFNGNILPSLNLLAMIKYLQPGKIEWIEGKGLRLDEVSYPDGRKGTVTIPVDDKGCMLINYSGMWGKAFEHIAFHEIYKLHGNPSKIEKFRKILNQKVVIISLVKTGSTDMGPTPLETSTPLSTVHSNAINTILQGAFLTEAPAAVPVLLSLLMAVILIVLSVRLSPLYFFVSFLVLITTYIASNFFLFSKFNIVMNLSGVTIASISAFVVLLFHGYMTAARESALQKDILKAYFSPKIIDQILKSPDRFSLEGSGQELTVLFSDIVGFTTLSDNLHPAEVQRIISEYLENMTEIIFKHDGAVDKFMGDGIMAFWGYPEPEDKSAEENLRLSAHGALRAAVEMQRKMKHLKEKWVREGRKPLEMRVGINTGYVTLGNMGSRHRLEFTLIGKNVNLAQRLEGAAPSGGILMGSRTHSLVKGEIEAEEIKGLALKGFEEEVQAYLVKS
jgi:adenylate cyclase